MQENLDKDLQSLFKEQTQTLPENPFVGRTLRIIQKRQVRRVFVQRLLLALVIACCGLLSPFLIKGSILLTGGLNRLFESTLNYLATPAGMLAAGILTLSFLVFKRRRVF